MTHLHPLHLSVGTFLCLELVGAAALAFWVVARFPRLGPTSLRAAVAVSAAATLLMRLVPLAARTVAHVPNGGYVALLGCVLPATVATFLAAAWLLRQLANASGSRAC
ncbi:MAG TPA: hypothetical protein VFA05_03725 [Gaiellaceae bacterium]|nr:hypothetical protein [Gaiellaceae bacterium]